MYDFQKQLFFLLFKNNKLCSLRESVIVSVSIIGRGWWHFRRALITPNNSEPAEEGEHTEK